MEPSQTEDDEKKRQPEGMHVGSTESEAAFHSEWRSELLSEAWAVLESEELANGEPYFTVLAYRRDFPSERSEAIAVALGKKLNRDLIPSEVRQLIRRAKDRFAEILLDLLVQTMDAPSVERIYDELVLMNLMQYCEPAFIRYCDKRSAS